METMDISLRITISFKLIGRLIEVYSTDYEMEKGACSSTALQAKIELAYWLRSFMRLLRLPEKQLQMTMV
jgi:hypothetical protein